MFIFLLVVLSYALGSIPTSLWLGQWIFKKDIRSLGSGNAGASNVLRNWGWRPALVVLISDMFKGWLPPFLFVDLLTNPAPNVTTLLKLIAGCAAVLGHVYPIWAGFRGGKGVATAGGMVLGVYPLVFPICVATFVLVLLRTRLAALASLAASLALPLGLLLLRFIFARQVPMTLLTFSLLFFLFMLFTHRSNLRRLMTGTEQQVITKQDKQKKTNLIPKR